LNVEFQQGETEKTITVPILQRKDEEHRSESFAVQLANIWPDGAKLSKKSFMIVDIVTDLEGKQNNLLKGTHLIISLNFNKNIILYSYT